ncbi:MAG: hypothetical protein SFW67_14435 [Myxococcaceae bacterium]|nr:hypothetical protein [Myxococcaceae bacterium]
MTPGGGGVFTARRAPGGVRRRRRPAPVDLLGGVLLGAVCAVALKVIIWLVPLMLQVGD